jgi:hypothetical protein
MAKNQKTDVIGLKQIKGDLATLPIKLLQKLGVANIAESVKIKNDRCFND